MCRCAVAFRWQTPNYRAYSSLWNQTDWPLLSESQYNAFILNRAEFCIAVSENDGLIGMGRLLTDGIQYAYIQDLLVDKHHRGNGIGTRLLGHLVTKAQASSIGFIGLFSTLEAAEFYRSRKFNVPAENLAMCLTAPALY